MILFEDRRNVSRREEKLREESGAFVVSVDFYLARQMPDRARDFTVEMIRTAVGNTPWTLPPFERQEAATVPIKPAVPPPLSSEKNANPCISQFMSPPRYEFNSRQLTR